MRIFASSILCLVLLAACVSAVSLQKRQLEHEEHVAFLDTAHAEHRRLLDMGNDETDDWESGEEEPSSDEDEDVQEDNNRAFPAKDGTEIHRIKIKDFLNVSGDSNESTECVEVTGKRPKNHHGMREKKRGGKNENLFCPWLLRLSLRAR